MVKSIVHKEHFLYLWKEGKKRESMKGKEGYQSLKGLFFVFCLLFNVI